MKFTTSSQELAAALQRCAGAVSTNAIVPILEDYYLEVSDGVLTIKATDLEVSVITKMSVTNAEDGATCVPSRILLDTLKALPPEPVTIELADGGCLVVDAFTGTYFIGRHNADDFPQTPSLKGTTDFTLDPDVLKSAIKMTLFAASNDELRPALTGIYLSFSNGTLEFVATDAHKLSRYRVKASSEISSAVIPAKAMKLVAVTDSKVDVALESRNAFFTFGDTTVICRLIDAKYPDYNAVIPDNPYTLSINRASLLGAIRRVMRFANDTTNIITMEMIDDVVEIFASDMEKSTEAYEGLNRSYNGGNMKIGFNGRYLAEILNTLSSEIVQINLHNPTTAAIFSPAETDEDVMMLLMPVVI